MKKSGRQENNITAREGADLHRVDPLDEVDEIAARLWHPDVGPFRRLLVAFVDRWLIAYVSAPALAAYAAKEPVHLLLANVVDADAGVQTGVLRTGIHLRPNLTVRVAPARVPATILAATTRGVAARPDVGVPGVPGDTGGLGRQTATRVRPRVSVWVAMPLRGAT